jgi:3-phosphoshikimate 1-carboxyvinyltransferase
LHVVFQKKIGRFNKIVYPDSDKSITIRTFIIGSISEGVSKVSNALEGTDSLAVIACLRKLGVKINKIKKGKYEFLGKGLGSFHCKKNTVLDFSNSGTGARLIQGCCATNSNIQVKLTGDKSLSKRSMKKIIKVMEEFGAEYFPKNKFHFPLTLVSSDLPVGIKHVAGISSQIKSATILAGLNAFGKTTIIEKMKSRDHTERMLKHNSAIKIKKGEKNIIEIKGKKALEPINISVPGDPSTASFYAALCLLNKDSKIILRRVHINPTRIGFFNIIRKHNGKISFKNKRMEDNEMVADVHVKSSKIKNLKVEGKFFVSCQDEYPIMFAMAALLPGTSTFSKIADLSNKESPRAHEMKKILNQIGIRCKLSKNEMKVYGNPNLNVHGKKIRVSGVLDHRIILSVSILSLLTGVKANIKNFEQVRSSCPNFLSTISSLGGKFEIKKN